MTVTHDLKTDPAAFDAVARGDKTHEIRFDDRDFKVGDNLLLRRTRNTGWAMRNTGAPLEFTGEEFRAVITHIQDGYGLEHGWVILSIQATSPTPSGWKPIETAPKDGTRIMLGIFRWSAPVGRRYSDFYHLASWDGEASYPYIPNDWTHWRELPPPPGSEPSEQDTSDTLKIAAKCGLLVSLGDGLYGPLPAHPDKLIAFVEAVKGTDGVQPSPAPMPLFAVRVAQGKWESLQAEGYRMQRIEFARSVDGVEKRGSIDPWGKVLWHSDGVPQTPDVREALTMLVAALREYGTFPPKIIPALQGAEVALGMPRNEGGSDGR
ncbi:DUF3850 domain-containing protein [Ramlibacter sp.]|uniref:DUF3850 domain-containing protein n=1 Tax=Ramlibacter sp. TaxID=1917967 RepID=UPI003D0BBBF4